MSSSWLVLLLAATAFTILPLFLHRRATKKLARREAAIIDGSDPVASQAIFDASFDRKFPGHLASKALKIRAYGRFLELYAVMRAASRSSSEESCGLIMGLVCDYVNDLGLDPLDYTPNDLEGFLDRMSTRASVAAIRIKDWEDQQRYREQNYVG